MCVTKKIKKMFLRPYGANIVYQPYKINGQFNITNKVDNDRLTQIGLLFAALLCADLKSKVQALNIDQYSEGMISNGEL